MLKLAHWFKEVEESGFKFFNTLTRTIILDYNDILNYFNAHSTNASVESFNAKIKNSRLQLRGVRDKSFFYLDYLNFLRSPQLLELIHKKGISSLQLAKE
ncbi:transposase [Chryseobacterium polytrichastri]|uniref:Transposase n=1 Tax=Chryseobacterium polytrichastri TaxID=1302687 RepID=A0A1M7KUC3_9FLAO|nr:transposase [Chryseobacterium polytrichastri]SHM69154.1 Transposase [Chryseobacterium polytrichastri]